MEIFNLINFKKYLKTAQTALRGKTNGGFIYLIPEIAMNLLYLVPLMFIWKTVASKGVEVGMTLGQLLSYTYISALFSELLAVRTIASSWCYEGQLNSLYARPVPVLGQLIAQTVGDWLPMLAAFSLPMLIAAPLFGINIIPATFWFFPSLLLCVSLGFAIDFIFACVTIRLRGMAWLGYCIRMAVVSLFSGTVIPFRVLPFGLEKVFAFQPFGSLGGAPLSLFVGSSDPIKTILIQLMWNAVLWPAAILWFGKSKEKQVSYGG